MRLLAPLLLLGVVGCGGGVEARPGLHAPAPRRAPDFREVTTGQFHSCAISVEGEVACWGGNQSGQVGDGTTEPRLLPVWVRGLDYAVDVDAGAWQTCAIMQGGAGSCWGSGRPDLALTVPVRLGGMRSRVIRSLAVGQTVCALDLPGRAHCWGSALVSGGAARPTTLGATGRAEFLDVGIDRACLLLGPDRVQCFHIQQAAGQSRGTYGFPSFDVQPSVHDIRHLTVSGRHACFSGHGRIFCWGENESGQLGDGTHEPADQPVEVAVGEPIMDATAGWNHTCVVTTSGAVACWGDNQWGQLGNGSNVSSDTPVRVVGLDEPAIRVAAGRGHTCAVTMARRVYCWGHNNYGQLGTGRREDRFVATPVVVESLGRE